MSNWGVVTWIGVILLVLVLVIFYKGTSSNATAFSSALGKTAAALTGQGRSYPGTNPA